jgi:hypothetical protein
MISGVFGSYDMSLLCSGGAYATGILFATSTNILSWTCDIATIDSISVSMDCQATGIRCGDGVIQA